MVIKVLLEGGLVIRLANPGLLAQSYPIILFNVNIVFEKAQLVLIEKFEENICIIQRKFTNAKQNISRAKYGRPR